MELTTLIDFAEAYARLGGAVQEQLCDLVNANEPEDTELNANAVDLMKTLYPNLANLDPGLEDDLRGIIDGWETCWVHGTEEA